MVSRDEVFRIALNHVSRLSEKEIEWRKREVREAEARGCGSLFDSKIEAAMYAYWDSKRGLPTWLACQYYQVSGGYFRELRQRYAYKWDLGYPEYLKGLAEILVEAANDPMEIDDEGWDEEYDIPRDFLKVEGNLPLLLK